MKTLGKLPTFLLIGRSFGAADFVRRTTLNDSPKETKSVGRRRRRGISDGGGGEGSGDQSDEAEQPLAAFNRCTAWPSGAKKAIYVVVIGGALAQ